MSKKLNASIILNFGMRYELTQKLRAFIGKINQPGGQI